MYNAHNEHDVVWDKWFNEWRYASHAEIEERGNRFRFVYEGSSFVSPKTGKAWRYVRRGDKLGVVPA